MASKEELRQLADKLGLTRLTDAHLEEFGRAYDTAMSHSGDWPRDFTPADEPAHVFRARRVQPQG